MKNFLIDLCLVGLLLFMINGLFGDYGIQKAVFDRILLSLKRMLKNKNQLLPIMELLMIMKKIHYH